LEHFLDAWPIFGVSKMPQKHHEDPEFLGDKKSQSIFNRHFFHMNRCDEDPEFGQRLDVP